MDMGNGRVSIREVSQLSGVSISTVSRIINQTGRFSKETEKKVFQVMKDLNYVPNRLAQSMRSHNNLTVGILIPDILDEPHALIVRIIQRDLLEAGYITTIFNTGEDPSVVRRCIEMMHSQQMMGMVCIPSRQMTGEEVDQLPTVYFGRRPPKARVDNSLLISVDNDQVGYMAGKKLLAHGCRRICVMMDELDLLPHVQRLNGLKRALAEQQLTITPDMILRGHSSRTTQMLDMLQQWAVHADAPDGIFAMEVRPALGAMKVIQELRWPTYLIGFGKLRLMDYGLLNMDSIDEPVKEMAHKAASALLAMVEKGPDAVTDKVFQPYETRMEACNLHPGSADSL